jgi:sugar phosphate isomerase/epimerase
MKLGVRLESFRLPPRKALEEAEKLGVRGVQFDAVGDLSAKALSQTGRRELRNRIHAHHLELSAVGCPLRHGLDYADHLDARVEYVKQTMALSYELGARLVVVQAGKIPAPDQPSLMVEALADLGRHGDRIGAVLALETGLEDGATLAGFLRRFDTGSLAANLDPANLLMHDFDPYVAVSSLRELVAHVHARDARRSSASRTVQETPLGHGDIDWMKMLATLEEIDYRGWLVVERESGDDRAGDVARGVSFLRRFLPTRGEP